MDYQERHAPLFGVSITPTARDAQKLLNLARVADQAGLDLLTIQDHAYNPTFLDTSTLLAVIGGQTSQIKLLANVATLPLRPPAMLAKATATLDLLTGGRAELGLGAGAFWDGIAGYGGPRRTPGAAVEALREGMEIIRLLWQGPGSRPVSYPGQYYSLTAAHPGPAPVHDIGIWLGAIGPKMLRLTGELADGWIVSVAYMPPAQAAANGKIIDEAALAAGRAPGAIRRAYNIGGVILRPEQTNLRANRPEVLVGSAQRWADTIAAYYQATGMDTFIFWPAGGNEEEQFHLFAEEVVPAARAAIGAVGVTN